MTGTHDCPIGNILKIGCQSNASDVAHDIAVGPYAAQGWAITHVDGWTNLGDSTGNIEVWNQDGVNQHVNGAPDVDGLYAFETDGYGSAFVNPVTGLPVLDHFVATVDAEAGKTYEIKFNYASRTDGPGGDTDGFDVLWNGIVSRSLRPGCFARWLEHRFHPRDRRFRRRQVGD